MRRSMLWGSDVLEPGIMQKYLPLRPNEEIVLELIDCLTLLKIAQEDIQLDPDQSIQTLELIDGRGLLVVHCGP